MAEAEVSDPVSTSWCPEPRYNFEVVVDSPSRAGIDLLNKILPAKLPIVATIDQVSVAGISVQGLL